MTDKLFYRDSYKIHCEAKVVSVEKKQKTWEMICDRTIFYPEGGGQPADRGYISGIPVNDVRKRGDDVVHILGTDPLCSQGNTVRMELDWNHRYDYMQQHSGQHIISAVLFRALDINTLSVHLGDAYTTIETDRSEIMGAEVMQIEDAVQEIICSNLPITDLHVNQESTGSIDLRREPQVAGVVRVVQVGEYDAAPCGGVHLKSTGEVRLVKCIGLEKIRGHVRTVWKIGRRAAEDYRELADMSRELSTLLSVPRDSITARAASLLEEQRNLQQNIQVLESSYAAQLIEHMSDHGELVGNVRIVGEVVQVPDASIIRHMGALLPPDKPMVFCCICMAEQTLRWIIGVTGGVKIDFTGVLKDHLSVIGGKGGGRYPLWQGAGTQPDGIDDFLEGIRNWVRCQLAPEE